MSYYQKIKELIEDVNEDALRVWMMAQPLTEQLAITETLKEVIADIWGDEDSMEKRIKLAQLDNVLEDYVDKNLDTYNAKVEYEKAVEKRDNAFAEMEEQIEGIRAYIIECVTTNAPNAKEMKELALQIIEMEKVQGVYDPENWKGVL